MKTVRTIYSALLCCCIFAANDGHAQQSVSAAMDDLTGPQFNFMGFGDISYLSQDAGSKEGFTIGQAVAHLSASLDNSLSIFGEFSMTAKDSSYSTGLERMIVKYSFSDQFKLSVGRYHSPVGYWNSAYHHGSWLQTTVSRPEFVKFGSKIVPIHFVGALFEGTLTNNRLGLSYKAGFGNGRHANVAQAGDAGDINGEKAWMLQINAQPLEFFGLNAGLGFYSDRVSPDDRPDIDEQTVTAYIAWAKESPEVLVEFLHSSHERVSDNTVNGDVNAWYVQFAYRLKGKNRQWKPYLRAERTRVDASDPLLGDQGLNYDAGIIGLRWDFSDYAAIKAEYRNEEFNDTGRENNFRLQISFVLAKL